MNFKEWSEKYYPDEDKETLTKMSHAWAAGRVNKLVSRPIGEKVIDTQPYDPPDLAGELGFDGRCSCGKPADPDYKICKGCAIKYCLNGR